MDKQQIIEDLKSTLIDYRLTRTEKRALGSELKQTTESDRNVLRHEAFEMARLEMLSPDAKEVTKWLEETLKLLAPSSASDEIRSDVLFSPEDNCVAKICALLLQARKTVDVCVFTITDDRVASALLAAHRRKVDVRIISDNEKADDLGSDIFHLKKNGLPVRTDESRDHMHHKYAVFDRKTVLTGSYNWTRSAANRNEENLVVTNDKRLVQKFSTHFEKLWIKYA